MESARSLARHFAVQISKGASRGSEIVHGWCAFIRFLPRLAGSIRDLNQSATHRSTVSGQAVAPPLSLPAFFINLEARTDRKEALENEFRKLGAKIPKRFDAIAEENGALGCAQSHLNLLELIFQSGEDSALVVEDDLEFIAPASEISKCVGEFLQHPKLDVLCISYRLRGPKMPVSSNLAVANNIQSAAGYVVKRHAIPPLINVFAESVALLKAGVSPSIASIDIMWKKSQTSELFFAIPIRPLARQRESYSDIAKRIKFYK